MALIPRILPLEGNTVLMNINPYPEIKAIKLTKGPVKIMAMLLKINTMCCRLLHRWRKSFKTTRQEITKTSTLKRYPSSL